jgi:hypothetical protein
MLTACILLACIGLLGAFDIAYFHTKTCRLTTRPECRREAWLHVVRGFVYTAQFWIVPNVRFTGAWTLAVAALFAVDALTAAMDILEEPRARAPQGGLPGGEYLMHMVLSVLVGAMLACIGRATLARAGLPSAVVFEGQVPLLLRAALGVMGLVCTGVAVTETLALIDAGLPAPAPIHVSIVLAAPRCAVWAVTQDHVRHPTWDHRFSKITMLADQIGTGTCMRYEKRLAPGMTIRGWGRYKLHRPERQSTFAFGSRDRRSLIVEGVGLWLYRDVVVRGELRTEFRTSYTYRVRWGLVGRLFDRVVFRPLFQRETERSFARLARLYFPEGASAVAGATGRKRAAIPTEVRAA